MNVGEYAIVAGNDQPTYITAKTSGGGATTADALALIGLARRRVHEQFGVMLEPEVRLVGKISLPPFEADGQSG